MKKLLTLALLSLTLGAAPPPPPPVVGVRPMPKLQQPSFSESPMPSEVFTDPGDIRELASDAKEVWAASGGGLFTIDLATLEQQRLFDGGVAKMPADFSAPMQIVPAPFRMVNDLLDVDGNLFVAANEGLYISRNGKSFERVLPIGARSITGLAADDTSVWLTSTEALYRIDRKGKEKAKSAFVHPAGSRSIQGLALSGSNIWLATEDRGVVLFDGKDFHAKDKLAGLPTSWFVGVTSDGNGGAYAATLRDGALHLGADGKWERAIAYGAWGETATRIGEHACFGMQEGASCGARKFRGLPDPRVHLIFPMPGKILIGTEAGMALYDRA